MNVIHVNTLVPDRIGMSIYRLFDLCIQKLCHFLLTAENDVPLYVYTYTYLSGTFREVFL